MSVKDSPQARRSGTERDMRVGLIVTTGKAAVNEPDRLARLVRHAYHVDVPGGQGDFEGRVRRSQSRHLPMFCADC